MADVRPAAVAGTFYPAQPEALRRVVEGLLADGPIPDVDINPMMVVVPHAGYVYSGAVAAVAYRLVSQTVDTARRAVLLGPAHFDRFEGLATPGVDALATPLGLVEMDQELTELAEGHPSVSRRPPPHASEHSLEVQLPFLQIAQPDVAVAAMLTGDVDPGPAAAVLDRLLQDPSVVAVISSDLSHYLDYETARGRDTATAQLITGLQPEPMAWDDACGRTAIQAALIVARSRGWSCRLLDLRNSGDTAGPRERVVGYGSFAIGPTR